LRMARRKIKKARPAVITLPDYKNPATGRAEPPLGLPGPQRGGERKP
jgi:hypothetical protein